MPLGIPPQAAESQDILGFFGLLPESEVDSANITVDNPYHIPMLAYQGRSLPGIRTKDGKTRFISAVNGRNISKVDPRNLEIGSGGMGEGIFYFEDAPSKPIFVLYETEITHIDDFDLSEVESMELLSLRPIQLQVTKDGVPSILRTDVYTKEGGKLSQKKFIEKEDLLREIYAKIGTRCSISTSMLYYRQEKIITNIRAAIAELTQEEIAVIKSLDMGVNFGIGMKNDFNISIYIDMSLPAAEMAAEMKKLIREYAVAKGKPMKEAVAPVEAKSGDLDESAKAERRKIYDDLGLGNPIDPPQPAVPRSGTSIKTADGLDLFVPDDDSGISFDDPNDKTPPDGIPILGQDDDELSVDTDEPTPREGIDLSGMEVGEVPKQFTEHNQKTASENILGDLEFIPESEVVKGNIRLMPFGFGPLKPYEDKGRTLPVIIVDDKVRVVTAIKGRRLRGISQEYSDTKKLTLIAEFEDGTSLPVIDNRLVEEVNGEKIEKTLQRGPTFNGKFTGLVVTNKSKGTPILVAEEQIVTEIQGKKISTILEEDSIVDTWGLTAIVYFEDAPSTPRYVLRDKIVSFIDDTDLSNVEGLSIEAINDLILMNVTKEGRTSRFRTERGTFDPLTGTLSQKKFEEKENVEKDIRRQRDIRVSIAGKSYFYENQDSLTKIITESIDLLTSNEVELMKSNNISLILDSGSYDSYTYDSIKISIDVSRTPEEIAEKIRHQLSEYAKRNRLTLPEEEKEEQSSADVRINIPLPNQNPKIKIRDIPKVIIEAIGSRVGKVIDSFVDRLDGNARKPKPEKVQQKQETPTRIRRTTRGDIARLLLESILIFGGGWAGVKAINKIPAVQSGHVIKYPTASDVEDYINKEPAEQSQEKTGETINFSSLDDAVSKGYIIILDGTNNPKKGYDWLYSEDEVSKMPKGDPRQYSLKKL